MDGDGRLSQAQDSLHEVLLKWQAYRDQKDYAGADALKVKLEALGVTVQASGTGPQAKIEFPEKFDLVKLEAIK